MFLCADSCTLKCNFQAGYEVCQNADLLKTPSKDVPDDEIISRYLENHITSAIVIGGLEPMDQFDELIQFITAFRKVSGDPVIIYTGYNYTELVKQVNELRLFRNVIMKFGRYIPHRPTRFDSILGVTLASNNQYVIQITH